MARDNERMIRRAFAGIVAAGLLIALSPAFVHAVPNDTIADRVLGQPGFESATTETSATGMTRPIGIAVDARGRLYVSEELNNRILVFDSPAAGDTTADTVLGQANFTTGDSLISRTGLSFPTGMAFDSFGRLYVSEFRNHRVLIYDSPTSGDTTADTVLGQANFTTAIAATTRTGMSGPSGVAIDAFGRLYVSEFTNNRILIFDSPTSGDTTADTVLGQPNFTTSVDITTRDGMSAPDGIALDTFGRLYVADRGNNRILIFDTPASGDTTADTLLGQPNYITATPTTTANGLRVPRGLAIDAAGRLYVADRDNHRVLIFDNPANDTTADTVLGEPDFLTRGATTNSSGMSSPAGVAVDTAGRLYVADRSNSRVLVFFANPRISQTTRSNNHQRGQIYAALSLPFEFAGKDSDGIALSGRTPAYSESFAPSGASGYSLDTLGIRSTSASGTAAVRLTLGDKNGVYQVTATIDDTTAVFTAYSDSINISAQTWTMFGPNKNPTTATRAGVIEDDGFGTLDSVSTTLSSGYVVYWSNPAISPDSAYGLFVTPATIDTGRSYWLYSAAAKTLDVDGTVLTETLSIRISPGWNMVSNPFPYFIDFDSDIQFQVDGGTKKSPQLAQTDSIADGVIFWYDNANTTFRWGPRASPASSTAATASSLQLKPFTGYEIYAHQTCTMHFYPNPRDPASSTVLNQTPAPRYTAENPLSPAGGEGWGEGVRSAFSSYYSSGGTSDWEIQLSASGTNGSQTAGDIDNYVGVRAAGSLTVRDAPASPGGGMGLSVAPYGQAGTYALHYAVSPADATWDVNVYSSAVGNVTISASGLSGLPSTVSSLLLQDLTTGTVTDMKTSPYTYASSAAETRIFHLSATGVLPSSSSSVKAIYPAACLIAKTFNAAGCAGFAHPFRRLRDFLLGSPCGRALVETYYRIY